MNFLAERFFIIIRRIRFDNIGVALVLLVSGCSTSSGFKNYSGADAACISGNNLNPIEFAKGDAATIIEAMDGVSTEGANTMATGRICFPPGKHTVIVGMHPSKVLASHHLIDRDFPPGSRFKTKGRVRFRESMVHLYELHDRDEIEVGVYVANTEREPLKSLLLPFSDGTKRE
jgi:hypothetical protein